MKKADSKEMLQQQRAALLNHAHIEAMKQINEKKQPFELSVSGALSFREFAKSKMEESEYDDLMSVMFQYQDADSPNVLEVLADIYCILKNYADVKQAFGMFLPPLINLKFQTGYYEATKIDSPEIVEEAQQDSSSSLSSADSNGTQTKKNFVSKDYVALFVNKVKERFEEEKEVFEKFLQILPSLTESLMPTPEFETNIFNLICDLFQDYEDLIEEFKPFVPNADYIYQNQISECNEVKDPSVANVYKFGTHTDHYFFDKVKKALVYKEVYDNFLRCLDLYNEDIVTNVELIKVCTSFLGRHPELLKEFKDLLGFKENGENYEIIPMKIVNMENNRCDPELALDIDYATDGRNGASYRALPKDHCQPLCSGRTPLCKEVLNDTWVSFPSWSEDSTFVTSCKTQYEEIMYRCEDERFEMDMAIQSNTYAIQLLDNVQKRINKMHPDEKTSLTLDDTLGGTSTVLYQRALHRLYGDKLEELVTGLKRNPVVAVPIILKRLKGKDEEWREKQKEFNIHWRMQIDNFYLKSLDHQGINFKQNDNKNFRAKNILKEMEMIYAEKKVNEGFNTSEPHILLEFKDMTVCSDALNLMNQFLKKLPGIYRNDRSRIEYLIRRFIPDFFGVPRTESTEEEDNDNDNDNVDAISDEEIVEKMDIDNQCDERSGNTSPSGSGMGSKEDGLSDAEGSNSCEEIEMSDAASDKSSSSDFIEEIDVFDKMESLLPIAKNLPYVLFFVNKTWFVFFRQFHILCERLSRLLFEGIRRDDISKKNEDKNTEEKPVPTYNELVEKLSNLLSGAIDYNQFEEQSRSLYGIHAFVTFTMDKLVSCTVRQLQQVVCDDICKQCTSLFFTHSKVISDSPYISLLERSHLEADYLRKVEAETNEENCFQVVWHKEDHTLTIQLIEKECDESSNDPCEAEKWSHYLENYVNSADVEEEILSEATGIPVFLQRNLKKQQEYWRRKVAIVDNLWKTRHSSSFLKKNSPYSLKRKAALLAKSLQKRSDPISAQPTAETVEEKTLQELDNFDKSANIQISENKESNIEVVEGSESNVEVMESKESNVEVIESKESNVEEIESKESNIDIVESNESNVDIIESKESNVDIIESKESNANVDIIEDEESNVEVIDIKDNNMEEIVIKDSTLEDIEVKDNSLEMEEIKDNSTIQTEVKDNILEDMEMKFDSLIENDPEHDIMLVDLADDDDYQKEINVIDESSAVDCFDALTELEESDVIVDVEDLNEEGHTSVAAPSDFAEEDISTQIQLESERASDVMEAASHVLGAINVEDATEEISTVTCDETSSPEKDSKHDTSIETEEDKDSIVKADNESSKPRERRKALDGQSRPRKRLASSYIKRRAKKARSSLSARERKKKPVKTEEYEDILFDYDFFSNFSDEQKYTYLALHKVNVEDNTEVSFRQGRYKIFYVQNCHTYIYRKNSLTRAKEIHKQISEMKTSNFNAWHRIWMDRFVTSDMIKSCHSWLRKGDPETYKVVILSVGDCTKAPYIPYNKYKIRYYKIEPEE